MEGMKRDVILKALRDAGATFDDRAVQTENQITIGDLYRAGLSGKPESKEKRRLLLTKLSLPEHLSTKALKDILSRKMSKEELFAMIAEMEKD